MKTHTYKIAWKDLPQESVTRAMTGGLGPESGKPGLSHSVMGKPLRVSDQVSCTVRRGRPQRRGEGRKPRFPCEHTVLNAPRFGALHRFCVFYKSKVRLAEGSGDG